MVKPEEMRVLDRLRLELPRLSGREARVARHLMANYPLAGLRTVAEFAQDSGVSTATVLRLVKRLGFPVYADFQTALRAHLEETLQSPLIHFGHGQDHDGSADTSYLDRFLDAMTANMQVMRDHVPASEFDSAVTLLCDPKRDIHVVGGRTSTNVGTYFADLLSVIRGKVYNVGGQTERWPQHLLEIGKNSVHVTLDVRRYQQDVIEFTRSAVQRDATVILLTDIGQSPAARVAHHVLGFPVVAPSIFDVLGPGMVLADALVGAVADRLGEACKKRIETLEELRWPFALQK